MKTGDKRLSKECECSNKSIKGVVIEFFMEILHSFDIAADPLFSAQPTEIGVMSLNGR